VKCGGISPVFLRLAQHASRLKIPQQSSQAVFAIPVIYYLLLQGILVNGYSKACVKASTLSALSRIAQCDANQATTESPMPNVTTVKLHASRSGIERRSAAVDRRAAVALADGGQMARARSTHFPATAPWTA
jgi:hypothetical protein